MCWLGHTYSTNNIVIDDLSLFYFTFSRCNLSSSEILEAYKKLQYFRTSFHFLSKIIKLNSLPWERKFISSFSNLKSPFPLWVIYKTAFQRSLFWAKLDMFNLEILAAGVETLTEFVILHVSICEILCHWLSMWLTMWFSFSRVKIISFILPSTLSAVFTLE